MANSLTAIPPCEQPQAIDSIVAAARSAHPSANVTDIFLYGASNLSTVVRFADNVQVYVDACTLRVLGQQPRYAGFFGTLESLHKARFAKRAGKLGVRAGAFGLLALVVLGLVAWWPRRKAALTYKPHLRGRSLLLNLHMTTGVYASIVLLVVGATAIPISLGWSPEKALVPSLQRSVGDPSNVSLERAWQAARAGLPRAFRWASIALPRPEKPIEIDLVAANAPHDEAKSIVYVDPRNGRVLASYPYDTLDAAVKLQFLMLAVHTGRAGGPAGEGLLFLGMIAVVVLAYVGVDSFVSKRRHDVASNAGRFSQSD